jgi:hypothetical protein
MYDLNKLKGSYKGNIAECMFKLTSDKIIINKFFNKNKFMEIFSKYLTNDQIEFINNNWYSIDAVEFNQKEKVLYEIKSKKAIYANKTQWPLKITKNTFDLYSRSKKVGFIPKVAIVWFHQDWKYDIEIKQFESVHWSIDKPKKWDKK